MTFLCPREPKCQAFCERIAAQHGWELEQDAIIVILRGTVCGQERMISRKNWIEMASAISVMSDFETQWGRN